MNRKQFEANEKRIDIFNRDNYSCQNCKIKYLESELQLAHRINKGQAARKYIARWLNEHGLDSGKLQIDNIVHHEFNLVSSCGRCNDSFNIFFNPVETDQLIYKIIVNLGLL